MNPEQLKQLKPDDEIFIRSRYIKTADDGDVHFLLSVTSAWGKTVDAKGYSIPENVILPPPAPKHDPCRLFRAGDRVTPKVVNGRDFNNIAEEMKGKVLIVTQDENRLCNVYVRDGEDEFTIDPAYLELVTPVEELERYVVEPSDVAWFVVDKKHESGTQNVVMYMCALHPNPKAAAEAECKRLNAEYRKEQK